MVRTVLRKCNICFVLLSACLFGNFSLLNSQTLGNTRPTSLWWNLGNGASGNGTCSVRIFGTEAVLPGGTGSDRYWLSIDRVELISTVTSDSRNTQQHLEKICKEEFVRFLERDWAQILAHRFFMVADGKLVHFRSQGHRLVVMESAETNPWFSKGLFGALFLTGGSLSIQPNQTFTKKKFDGYKDNPNAPNSISRINGVINAQIQELIQTPRTIGIQFFLTLRSSVPLHRFVFYEGFAQFDLNRILSGKAFFLVERISTNGVRQVLYGPIPVTNFRLGNVKISLVYQFPHSYAQNILSWRPFPNRSSGGQEPQPIAKFNPPRQDQLPVGSRGRDRMYDFLDGDPTSLEPYTGPFTEEHAKHLLEKIGMGVDPDWLEMARGKTLREFVDLLVDSCSNDSQFFRQVDARAEQLRNYAAGGPGFFRVEVPTNGSNFFDYHRENLRSINAYLGYHALKGSPLCISMMLYLHQRLAVNQTQQLLNDLIGARHSKDYVSFLMKNTVGNYQRLVGNFAGNPANLYYLDNIVNRVGNYNENYARELMELHALGVERCSNIHDRNNINCISNYDEEDVKKVTKAVTGFDRIELALADPGNDRSLTYCTPNLLCSIVRGRRMWCQGVLPSRPYNLNDCNTVRMSQIRHRTYIFNVDRWYREPLEIFGARQIFNINPYSTVYLNRRFVDASSAGIVDNLSPHMFFNHPAASWYLALTLSGYYISPRIDERFVTNLANYVLLEAAFDLRQILKKILSSNAMFAREYKHTSVKTPFHWVVGLFRTFKVPVDFAEFYLSSQGRELALIDLMFQASANSNMFITRPPSVFGFPGFPGIFRNRTMLDGSAYMSGGQMFSRINSLFEYFSELFQVRIRAFDAIETNHESCVTLVTDDGEQLEDCPLAIAHLERERVLDYVRKYLPQYFTVLPERFNNQRFSWVSYLQSMGVNVNDVDEVLSALIRISNIYHTPEQYERLKRFLVSVPARVGSNNELIEEGCGWVAQMDEFDRENYLHHKISLAILMMSMNVNFWTK